MAHTHLRLLDNFAFLLMGNPSPHEILDFKASEVNEERISLLIQRKRANILTFDEAVEVEIYLQAEHLIRIAKAKAYGKLREK